MAFYSSYGGAGEVTGSCHLLEIGHIKILIDCGLFQGQEEELNYKEFGFNVNEINYLIVTHAHLDHIGRIPLLVKEGYDKRIICTKATYDITKLMLKNAAGILSEKEKPLYTYENVEAALSLFGTFLEYNESIELEEGITVSFKNAGHILGSATVKIEYSEDEMNKSIIFSGDIGQSSRIITSQIDYWEQSNYVVMESTYGDRLHPSLDISMKDFKRKVLETLEKRAVVVLPSFALERTQEILFLLKQMSEEGLLKNTPVYLDSPLAINVTKTFIKYPDLFNEEIQQMIKSGRNPFVFDELKHTYTKEESMQINETTGSKIIIAGSGMCEGGRVKFHLARYVQNENNMVLFIGYQVKGTLGRSILDGNKELKMEHSNINIKANISYVEGFSAHADQKNLTHFIQNIKDIYCIYLIHGDPTRLATLKKRLSTKLKDKVHIVKMKEKIYI